MIITDKKPKSFVLYADFEGALLRLSLKERGILLTMIYSYVNRGCFDEIPTTPLVDMAFAIIRAQLDRDREKYQRICERNAENGKYGGRPSKSQKSQSVSEKPKKAYNNNDNKNKNNSYSDINIGRTFDVDDFFDAALKRTFSEEE